MGQSVSCAAQWQCATGRDSPQGPVHAHPSLPARQASRFSGSGRSRLGLHKVAAFPPACPVPDVPPASFEALAASRGFPRGLGIVWDATFAKPSPPPASSRVARMPSVTCPGGGRGWAWDVCPGSQVSPSPLTPLLSLQNVIYRGPPLLSSPPALPTHTLAFFLSTYVCVYNYIYIFAQSGFCSCPDPVIPFPPCV